MNITLNTIPQYNNYSFQRRISPQFRGNSADKFIKNELTTICHQGRSNSIVPDSPMNIIEFLKELENTAHFKDSKKMLKKYQTGIENSPVKDIKVTQMIGHGSSAMAFETEDGKILKLTEENHFPLNRPVEDFDAAVYEKGKVKNVYYYLVEKCYPCESGSGFVDIMRHTIKQKGYRPYDLGSYDDFQIGFNAKGELKLLDPECAQYKTPFHKLAQVIKQLF